jgi:hypothetical protein
MRCALRCLWIAAAKASGVDLDQAGAGRLANKIDGDEAAKANAHVEAIAEPVASDLPIPDFLQRSGDGAPKAKRKRSPKPKQ